MASCSRAGACCGPGRLRLRVASTRSWMAPIQAVKSVSVAIFGIGGSQQRLEDLALQNAHLLLRSFQALAAKLRELQSALVGRERLLERQPAVFHLRDDGFELRQRLLEARLGAAAFFLGHRGLPP